MTTPLLGEAFLVNKGEKISRGIWKSLEQGEKAGEWERTVEIARRQETDNVSY